MTGNPATERTRWLVIEPNTVAHRVDVFPVSTGDNWITRCGQVVDAPRGLETLWEPSFKKRCIKCEALHAGDVREETICPV